MRWFFVYPNGVHIKRPKPVPAILAALVIALVCALRFWNPVFLDRLELMTYDVRVRTAQNFPTPTATNLAFVVMDEASIAAVKKSDALSYHFGLYWPRQIYGRLLEELSAQGARAVAFDILFDSLRSDHPGVLIDDGTGTNTIPSDEFFAKQMELAGNALIAITPEIDPPKLFATNAFAHGNIAADKDSDGILRRARAYIDLRRWHPLIESTAQKKGVSLTNIFVEKDKVILVSDSGKSLEIPLDENGAMNLKNKKNPDAPIKAKPFTDERIWHMGIVLAAQELKLDLEKSEVDLPRGKIILRGAGGVVREIPVDAEGYFYIDWRITPQDPVLARASVEKVLLQDIARLKGETGGITNEFRDKLVVIGSAAQGNDLTDRGATPLEKDTLLVSKHWNVANSVITGSFIRRATPAQEIALIIFLGVATALITWQFRAFSAFGGTLLLAAIYVLIAFAVFIKFRFWLPLAFPVLGVMLIEHTALLIHRAVFEEDEKRRVKHIFSKLVSPNVVNELLAQEKLELAGSRRELTVFFADVRGFTALTDQMQERVAEFVRTKNLEGDAAEKCFAESARETLEIVNLYLATVADAVKTHGGTLDKYIGDCVMAFWNAPTHDEAHALNCVRAAIHAQKAIADLNVKRLAQNTERATENASREAAGLPPRPPLSELFLGTGINTGPITVGLMGSDDHGFNYTVFGREVNLASRLEGVSGTGRIIVGETTFKHLKKIDPELAARCVEQTPVTPKGFRDPVRIFEVPWK